MMIEELQQKICGKAEIVVRHGVITEMQKKGFGTRPTIRKALRGDYNEYNKDERKRAFRIRKYAYMEMGGLLTE